MITAFLVFRTFWKRILSSLIIIAQLIVSAYVIAYLYFSIDEYKNAVSAVADLPEENSYFLNIINYYDDEYVLNKLNETEGISAGRAYSIVGKYEYFDFAIVAYDDAIIKNYAPKLSDGVWLDNTKYDFLPAVASKSLGYRVGDKLNIGKDVDIKVVGILDESGQYMMPSGGASSSIFNAKMVVDNAPVVIIRKSDYEADNGETFSGNMPSLLTYVNCDEDKADFVNKYGELTDIKKTKENFYNDSKRDISGLVGAFILSLILSITATIANYIIQFNKNRKRYTIYYLIGMSTFRMRVIEYINAILVTAIGTSIIIMLIKYDIVFPISMVDNRQLYAMYALCSIYFLVLFLSVSSSFINKLIKNGIAKTLKDINGD